MLRHMTNGAVHIYFLPPKAELPQHSVLGCYCTSMRWIACGVMVTLFWYDCIPVEEVRGDVQLFGRLVHLQRLCLSDTKVRGTILRLSKGQT
eukprot:2613371-Amphidinium_carterae.1